MRPGLHFGNKGLGAYSIALLKVERLVKGQLLPDLLTRPVCAITRHILTWKHWEKEPEGAYSFGGDS